MQDWAQNNKTRMVEVMLQIKQTWKTAEIVALLINHLNQLKKSAFKNAADLPNQDNSNYSF